MQNEILTAEILLSPVNTEKATADIDLELRKVEQALQSYSCTASMLEYSTAVLSGILAGAVDAFLIGKAPLFPEGSKAVDEQLCDGIDRVVANLFKNDGIPKQEAYSVVKRGIPAQFPELERMAQEASPLGMAAAVLFQMGRGGMMQVSKEKVQFFPSGVEGGERALLVCIAVIVGVLKWLSDISAEDKNVSSLHFKTLDKLCELIRSVPEFPVIIKEMERWQRQLPNEMKSTRKKYPGEPGVEQVFSSFCMMLCTLPMFQQTDLQQAVHVMQEGKRLKLDEIPIIHSLSRQAFPVMLNELIVRTLFFALRLADELNKNGDIGSIHWSRVMPFGNRDIDRLLAISAMTLSVADTADAAVHAAIDSNGDTLFFATRFVTRFNYVAAGRAIFAVAKEVSNEKMEAELIHKKRILTEAKTAKALEVLQKYQEQLEERVSEYLTEDITAFIQGLECMDQGLAEKNSDKVIKGNVIIQNALGRTAQFTDQHEFDELMDSDTPFKF